ncbi:hypothetical protein EDB86DRAFT_3082756 [Lactarius hatsudake]|nr:hypothetical protein EDB86DRAFT_3082756 [Lactarius hatsudake]
MRIKRRESPGRIVIVQLSQRIEIVTHILSTSQDAVTPGSSHIPNTSQEAAVPKPFDVPDASQDTVAPKPSHILNAEPQTADSSDSKNKMDTESILQDDNVLSDALERDTFPLIHVPRAPYPEVHLACHFTATYWGLLTLNPSNHMGDLIERCTILMGIVLNFHTNLSYIRDGLSKHRQLDEQKKS